MKDIRILVTGVGSIAAVSVCRCFKSVKERNIYVVGADIKEQVPNMNIDKYYQNKRYDDPNLIEHLISICKKEKIDLIISLVDGELYQIAKHRDDFLKVGTIVCLNEADTISLIQNKYELYNYLAKHNIDTPKAVLFNNIVEFIDGCKKLGFPNNDICYKPITSSGSRGFRKICNQIDYENYLFKDKPTINTFTYDYVISLMRKVSSFPEMMLMEFLPGALINIEAFAIKGQTKKLIVHTYPSNDGNFTGGNIIIDKEVEKYCEDIISTLKLDGYFGIQLAYSKDNVVKLIEINPRIQGSAIITYFEDINMPYYEIKYRLGEKIDFSKEIKPIKVEQIRDYVAFYDK